MTQILGCHFSDQVISYGKGDGVSSMIMLCYVRLQLTAGNLLCGLNDISGHVGESHMSGKCSQSLEPKVVIQPQGNEFRHQSE